MTGIATALLAASLAAPPNPLPDGKTIDIFSYSFTHDGPFGPGGHLSIFTDGKVTYSHATAPHTGSGGVITQKSWTLTKEETTELFRKLIDAGLLEIPDEKKPLNNNQFTVASGRWQFTVHACKMPDKVMEHLRPLLVKAHPLLWDAKPVKLDSGPPKFDLFQYTFTPRVDGEEAIFTVARDGTVTYKRRTHPTSPGGQKVVVNEQWRITAKEAETLFNTLIADGLFDLEDTRGGKIPNHNIVVQAGRWSTTFYPKAMPEKLTKHFLPRVVKVDPEFWK